MINNSSEHFIFRTNESLSILDMRSIGYYKVNQSNNQDYSKPCYEFRPLQELHDELSELTNILRREKKTQLIHIYG